MVSTERREKAAELYQELRSVIKVAAVLDCAPSTVYLDLKALDVEFFHTNTPQTEERVCARDDCENLFRPTLRQVRAGFGKFCSRKCDHEAHRIHPKAVERVCAREGCDGRFTPTGSNVAMGSGKFCSRACASAVTRNADKGKTKIVTCPNCGKKHSRFVSQIGSEFCTRECWGKYRWKRGIAISPHLVSLVNGRSRQKWSGRWNGHKGAAAGIEAGRAKGGRPPKMTSEQQQEIYKLKQDCRSTREIARIVFGDARYYKRVQRYLNR